MSYRVETAKSKRAGCQAKRCKQAGIKIDKGELRFGVWIEAENFASWTWKHWGCVTGMQIENLRKALADPDQPDGYNWEMLDGYEGDEPSSLENHPDLQEKVRRVIMQGYIDPEDFNGDPEMNVLGKKGLYLTEKQKRDKEDEAAKAAGNTEEDEEDVKPAKAKRGRAKVESDTEEVMPAKKKRATKVKMEGDDNEEELKPAKKSRAKTAKTEEAAEMNEVGIDKAKPAPAKKSRAKKIKAEDEEIDENQEETKLVPAKKAHGKKAGKQEDMPTGDSDGEDTKPAPARKARGKKVAKQEDEQVGEANEEDVKPAPAKKARGKKAVKQEDEQMGEGPEENAKPAPAPKRARAKKAVKQEAVDDVAGIDGAATAKPAAKRGRKGVKTEASGDTSMTAPEASTTAIAEGATANTTLLESEPATAVKGEQAENTNMANIPNAKHKAEEAVTGPAALEADFQATNEEESESQTKKKVGRGKKGAARTSRSRTASKA